MGMVDSYAGMDLKTDGPSQWEVCPRGRVFWCPGNRRYDAAGVYC
jgi:hypothetical protein